VRHLFGAQLKKKMLSKEDRADLLGHGGDSETSERYGDYDIKGPVVFFACATSAARRSRSTVAVPP
jgi:hypothetical protein